MAARILLRNNNHRNKKHTAIRYHIQLQISTTSVLNATTLIYAIGAGITAAAGTRLALQLILVQGFYIFLIPITRPLKSLALLFFVTTSPIREWVICVPAAFLGCGSRFSGSLSGIEL
jgi:hypothetical protein